MTDTEIMRRIGEAYRRYGLDRTFSREELLGAGKSNEKGEAVSNNAQQRLQSTGQQSLPQEEREAGG